MKYSYIFTIALVCSTLKVSAQSNYKPGYFISQQGDTTKGYINYREWDENPEAIDFKIIPDNTQRQRLSPVNTRLVTINGMDIYQSYAGKISADAPGAGSRDTSYEQKTVFLKLLTRGNKIALYEYRDRIKSRYLASINNAYPVELIFRSYKENEQNIDERTYRKQLSIIASQNQKLTNELNMLIQRADYSEPDLVRVINYINDVTDNSAITPSPAEAKTFSFFGGVAANVSFYKTSGGIKDAGAPNATSVLPKILAGFNVYINPRIQKTMLRVEAGAALGRYSVAYTSKDSPYDDVVFNFNQLNLSISPEILYNVYNKTDFKFYVGGGMQAAAIAYSGKKFANADGTPSTLAKQPFDTFIKTSTSLVFKPGW